MKNNKNGALTASKVIEQLESHKAELHKFGVEKIGLFGSYIKDKSKGNSDLDFIVTFSDATFDNYIELKFFLEVLFHKKIDLVIEENLKPALRYVKEEALFAEGV